MPELLGRGDDLGGEGLVDLDQVDVVDGHAGPLEGLADGLDGPEAHDLGVEAGHAAGHDAGQGGDAELAGPGVAHDDDRGRAVVERAGVAGRDRAALAEDRLELGQALEGGARPGAVVLGHHRAVGQGDRDDLPLEEAVLLGGHGPGLGQQRRTRPSPGG